MRFVIAAAALAALLVACGGDETVIRETPQPTAAVLTSLPAAWPADLPLFPDAELINATVEPNGDLTASFRTAASQQEVDDFYVTAFLRGAWNGQNETGSGITSWLFANPEARLGGSMTVTRNPGSEQTDIVMFVFKSR